MSVRARHGKNESVSDEPLTFDSSPIAKAERFPIMPGTLRVRVGLEAEAYDDGSGTVYSGTRVVCAVDYKTGRFCFVNLKVRAATVSYALKKNFYMDTPKKGHEVKMVIHSTPLVAKVHKMNEHEHKPPTDPNPIYPQLYFQHNGAPYNHDGVRACGYTCIPVLEFLWGRRFDQVVMGYIHGLRPTTVRVSVDGGNCCDARRWRVTVYTDKTGKWVEAIHQEIEVNLPEGVVHGQALGLAKEYGIDSPQVKWHQDATGYAAGLGGYRKTTEGGKSVPWTFKSKRNKQLWRTIKKKK